MPKALKPRRSPSRSTSKKPTLTEREAAQLDRQRAQNMTRDERPEAKFVRKKIRGGKTTLMVEAADNQDEKLHGAAMMEALGTRSIPFINDTLSNIGRVMSKTCEPTEQQYNAALAILAAVEPQNELEATLAAQMVMANDCAVRCMRGMLCSDWTDHHRMYGDLANKFMRTFTAQVDSLAKLRRGGEQVVKHVYVQEGGQAVIAGTVNTGGRNIGNDGQPFGTGAAPQFATLPCPDPTRDEMPIPCNAERQMQAPRRQESGSSEG